MKANRQAHEFCILCTVRTGSTYLIDKLDMHADISCYGEIFHPSILYPRRCLPPEAASAYEKSLHFRITRHLKNYYLYKRYVFLHKFLIWGAYTHPRRFLDARLPRYRGIKPIIGYKALFYFHGFESRWMYAMLRLWLWRLIGKSDIAFILLTRGNLLRQFVSMHSAIHSGVWHVGKNDTRPELPVLHFVPEQFEAFVRGTRRREAYMRYVLARYRRRYIRVHYELLIGDPAMQDARILDFIGAAQQALATPTKKVNDRPLSECFSNWRAVADYCKAKGLTRWISEKE